MKGRKPNKSAVRRGVKDSFRPSSAGDAKAKQAPPSKQPEASDVVKAYQAVPTDMRVGVQMPGDVAADPVMARTWAWVAPPVNQFTEQDMPVLRLLVHWHMVAEAAEREMGGDPFVRAGGVVAKSSAVTVLKQASAEIRALSDMLGLSPLARTRIGLMDAAKVKTAAETAAMFQSIDAAYGILPADAEVRDVED